MEEQKSGKTQNLFTQRRRRRKPSTSASLSDQAEAEGGRVALGHTAAWTDGPSAIQGLLPAGGVRCDAIGRPRVHRRVSCCTRLVLRARRDAGVRAPWSPPRGEGDRHGTAAARGRESRRPENSKCPAKGAAGVLRRPGRACRETSPPFSLNLESILITRPDKLSMQTQSVTISH